MSPESKRTAPPHEPSALEVARGGYEVSAEDFALLKGMVADLRGQLQQFNGKFPLQDDTAQRTYQTLKTEIDSLVSHGHNLGQLAKIDRSELIRVCRRTEQGYKGYIHALTNQLKYQPGNATLSTEIDTQRLALADLRQLMMRHDIDHDDPIT